MSKDYNISAVCRVLKINRSKYYYKSKPRKRENDKLIPLVTSIFYRSRKNYGTRKIKHELAKLGYQVSRRKIGRIMQEQRLVSNYTKARYKPHSNKVNNTNTPNLLSRDFNRATTLDVVVSDLTYVRVGDAWCYVCLIVDLWNREIIGWSAGAHKDAVLVRRALYSIPYRLDKINIFHTDRGSEFDNKLIEEALQGFEIKHSLSAKGCPYDNAVIEATNKILKVEFIYQYKFTSLKELECLLFDYIHWYNHKRIHGSLDYHTPISLRKHSINYRSCRSPLNRCPKKG